MSRSDVLSRPLLQVLHLLTDLLDQQLQLDGGSRRIQTSGFRTERIGLSIELLHQKVQAFSSGSTLLDNAHQLIDVNIQAAEFFGHIDPNAMQRHLLADKLQLG